jgi:nitrogen fixation protein NifB
MLKAKNLVVKINTVVIPGINTDHVAVVAEEAANLGVDVMNCIPMIPVEGTPFEQLGAPTDHEMSRVRDFASLYIPQMYHCRKCRSDAAGLIYEDETNLKKQQSALSGFQNKPPVLPDVFNRRIEI